MGPAAYFDGHEFAHLQRFNEHVLCVAQRQPRGQLQAGYFIHMDIEELICSQLRMKQKETDLMNCYTMNACLRRHMRLEVAQKEIPGHQASLR
eukprot:1141042-Pelagomonas_calceolata.AAC.7